VIQPIRGRIPQIGYFLRGATRFALPRTINALARLVMGILFGSRAGSVTGMQEAVGDAPSANAMRDTLRSKKTQACLARILDWKARQIIRKALRKPVNRRGPIVLAIDSTFKSTLSRLAYHVFHPGKGGRVGNYIFVFGLLIFPDGRQLPLRPRQKLRGKKAPSQVDLAAELVRHLAPSLRGLPVIVTADAMFFSKTLLRPIQAAGFHYVIACKGNTVLARGGPNLESLRWTIRLRGSSVTLPAKRGERQKRYSVALRRLTLRTGGTQAVVFSRPHRRRGARVKFLVSDLLDATAAQIVRLYGLRWQIELFFRDVKSYLGLSTFRVTAGSAPCNVAMLVTLGHQFLHWRGDGVERPRSTLACLRELSAEVTADDLAVLERAFETRHRRKKIREHFRPPRRPKAHASKRPHRGETRGRTAS
jgi:hypothetical protein